MTDEQATDWINANAPADLRWWIHDRLRSLASASGSVIPCAASRQWMIDNAEAQESFAKTAATKKDMEQYKLRRDCAWAFRYVAEKAQDAESASSPNAKSAGTDASEKTL